MAKTNATNASSNVETLEQAEKRIAGLVATAIKSNLQAAKDVKTAFAAAFYFAMKHGECKFLNELHKNLPNHVSLSMRSFAIRKVHEHFAMRVMEKETVQNEDGSSTTVILANRIPFVLKYKANGENAGYSLVRLNSSNGKEPEYEGRELKDAKAIKRAIINAGEDALEAIEWVSDTEARTLAPEFGVEQANKGFERYLIRVAKNAKTTGKSEQELVKAATAFGLTTEAVGRIKAAFAANDDSDTSEDATASNNSNNNKANEKAAA